MYVPIGNAGPDNDGTARGGDNLFTVSVVALDLKTGAYKWHFQEVHHDIWDYDSAAAPILADVRYQGSVRKVLMHTGKTGFMYVLDRTNGKPLIGIEERAVPQEPRMILGYPVISFDPAVAHAGSVRMLLGENPDPKLIENLSNDLQVTAQTPPTFIFHTTNDNGVPVENSVRFYLALRKAKVPVEMHLFENGPHGVGMALNDPALSAWPALLMNWLRARGLLTRPN